MRFREPISAFARSGAQTFQPKLLRQVALLLFVLVLYSILLTSFHHHADFKYNRTCAICKFTEDLSSGDKAALQPLIIPYFVIRAFDSDSFILFFRIMTVALIDRAPPVYIPS